jgi:hypothetical protein
MEKETKILKNKPEYEKGISMLKKKNSYAIVKRKKLKNLSILSAHWFYC